MPNPHAFAAKSFKASLAAVTKSTFKLMALIINTRNDVDSDDTLVCSSFHFEQKSALL